MKKKMKGDQPMRAADYLKLPYSRMVVPEEDGTFRGEIPEFEGCIATGDSAAEALASLEAVAEAWIEACLAQGLRIPEPVEEIHFSGKLVLRLPRNLHRKAAFAAQRDKVSLNQFIATCIAEHVGARSAQPAQAPAPRAPIGIRVFTQYISAPDPEAMMAVGGGGLARYLEPQVGGSHA